MIRTFKKVPLRATLLPQLVIILVVCFVVYFNALFNGFVYDDRGQILENNWITNLSNIPEVFSKSVWAFRKGTTVSNFYRPLMHVVYMFDYHIFGLNPWGFHLINICFHAGVSMLVFLITAALLRQSTSNSASPSFARDNPQIQSLAKGEIREGLLSPPFVAAMLFAVHPIHTEAVTWIAGLPEVSFTFFCLLSFYFYMRFDNKNFYILSLITFLLATLCKETALVLPVILMGYDYNFKGRISEISSSLKRYIPYVLVGGAYFLMRLHALGSLAPHKQHVTLTIYQNIINVFPLFVHYLEKLILPINLNAFYVLHPITSIFEAKGILSLAIVSCFAVLTFYASRKKGLPFISLLFIIAPLLPAFYIPGLGENTFAERYLYLPSFGFAAIFSLVTAKAGTNETKKAVIITATLIVTVIYSIGTASRNVDWRDDYSLFTDTVEKSPDGALPHMFLGDNLRSQGRIDEAIEQYRIALTLNQDDSTAHNNLAIIYHEKGLLDEAVQHLLAALRLAPDFADAHYNIGMIYMDQGLTDQAIEHLEKAVGLAPGDSQFRGDLDRAYEMRDRR